MGSKGHNSTSSTMVTSRLGNALWSYSQNYDPCKVVEMTPCHFRSIVEGAVKIQVMGSNPEFSLEPHV